MTGAVGPEIFALWPSLAAFAADAEVSYGAAKQMRRRGMINAKYWPALFKGAAARNIDMKSVLTMLGVDVSGFVAVSSGTSSGHGSKPFARADRAALLALGFESAPSGGADTQDPDIARSSPSPCSLPRAARARS
jgi:hypothetical protein